ncbi:MAG: hypothetical protein EA403_11340 [Spirochaetaceae bacterium]|nr:MAG: hypothetical protein EA403_11340 [Spirochaetaceae bacterium]
MAPAEKHTPFFNLIDALKTGRCPVCARISLRLNQFFDTLLYQNVNNRGFRADLRANGGFCAHHAHDLAGWKDGLAVAIMHLEFLEAASRNGGVPKRPDASRTRGRSTVSGGTGGSKAPACPACRIVDSEADTTLDLILQYGEDDEFLASFRESVGLCLPHYALLLEKNRRPAAGIVARQKEFLDALIQQTRDFIDSENVTAKVRPELSREQRLVWKRLIAHYYGDRDAIPL